MAAHTLPEHLLPFSFASWYPRFAHCALKGVIIPLPPEFLVWLAEDGLIMPIECDEGEDSVEWSDEDGGEGGNVDDDDADNDEGPVRPSFPSLSSLIALNLPCVPKLNFSAPIDATWVNCNTLKCCTLEDVYKLLKSSDFISWDVSQGAKDLVLKKYQNLHPSRSFRLWVSSSVHAIEQRDSTTYYPYLLNELESLKTTILSFWKDQVKGKFDGDYVLDVYITKSNKGYIVDFNPYADSTDSYLFTREELEDLKATEVEGDCDFRIVIQEKEVKPSKHSGYRGPIDAVEISGTGFEGFKKQCYRPSELVDMEEIHEDQELGSELD